MLKGSIFNIQRYSVQDGPGIRSTVFFKGCPLRCLWCSNPESQVASKEIIHRNSRCTRCCRCLGICPYQAVFLNNGGIRIERGLCDNCGQCVDVCDPQAIETAGREVTVEEVLEEVKKDSLFYRNSNGGVTISGGEPTFQPDFAQALLEECQRAGMHTTVDTCGYTSPGVMKKVLAYADLVLLDLKHMDDAMHRQITGVSNELILNNARMIVDLGVPMMVRIPVIPGINDSKENIGATARFVVSLERVTRVDLLPYHRLGVAKYEGLDREYALVSLVSPPTEHVQELRELVRSYGLDCEIGG